MPPSLGVPNLTLERVALEIRYRHAYLLWDNAGVLASEMTSTWLDLKLVEGTPAKISFTLGDTYEVAVELEKVTLIAHYPTANLEDFATISKLLISIVEKRLMIAEYSRVGLRFI